MTDQEKVTQIKLLLSDGGSLPSDDKITAYLGLARQEILNWM